MAFMFLQKDKRKIPFQIKEKQKFTFTETSCVQKTGVINSKHNR